MKNKMKIVLAGFPLMLMLAAGVARAGNAAIGEELAVVQAMATIANRDARLSYDYLNLESEIPAIPIVANSTTRGGGSSGVARNMPMTAQKTINDTTRGFVSASKCLSRISASASVVKRWVRCDLAADRVASSGRSRHGDRESASRSRRFYHRERARITRSATP